GSEVSTFTITRFDPSGFVPIALTLVIVTGAIPLAYVFFAFSSSHAAALAGLLIILSKPAVPSPIIFMASRRLKPDFSSAFILIYLVYMVSKIKRLCGRFFYLIKFIPEQKDNEIANDRHIISLCYI